MMPFMDGLRFRAGNGDHVATVEASRSSPGDLHARGTGSLRAG